MVGGATQAFSATVADDGSNSGVTWAVTSGGGSVAPATTASGATATYTAPLPVTAASAVLTATSVKDPTRSQSVTIPLTAIGVGAVAPATATLEGGQTQAFTETVSSDLSNSGVTWSIGSGPGTLTAVSSTGATYNAPAVVSAAATVTLTATSVKDPTKSSTSSITLTPISITAATCTCTVMDGLQQAAISVSITGDASSSGATFSVVSGGGSFATATVAGNSPSSTYLAPSPGSQTAVQIKVASAKDPTKSSTLNLTVNPAIAISPGSAGATVALPAATFNSAYSQTFALVAGSGTSPLTGAVVASGSLPAGLTLSSVGVLSGTPTGVGPSSFSVQFTDSATNPAKASFAYTLQVKPQPLVWTSPTAGPLTYTVGTAIAPIKLTTTGGTGTVSYTLNAGSLPAGLSLVGGQVSGTPTAPTPVAGGAVDFLATDSAPTTPATAVSPIVTMIVNPVALAISTTSLPGGTIGTPYGVQFSSTGGIAPIQWSVPTATATALAAAGLTFTSSGHLSGTPTAVESAVNLTFTATDSATQQQQTVSTTLPLTITAALTINGATTLPVGIANSAYTTTLAAAGGSGSGYVWSVTSGASSLTALNLSLSSAGVISGTPTAGGTASFSVQVKDSASNTASAALSLTIESGVSVVTSSLPAGTVGASYSQTLSASGGSGHGYTWSITSGASTLTATGLNLSSSGSITGTPTATGVPSFTVKVTDSALNTASATLSFHVYAVLSVTTSSLPNGTVGTSYSTQLNAAGGSGTGYSWTVTSGTGLSAVGLSLSSGGLITGTPTTSESATSFSVQVKDSVGNTGSATIGMIVNYPALTITTTNTAAGTVSSPYSQTFKASGGSGTYSWSITSGLATLQGVGLSFSSSGVLSGTPSAATSIAYTVRVTDTIANLNASAPYTLVVGNAAPTYSIGGQLYPLNNCGGTFTLPPISVAINTSPTQTVTSDSSGVFTFANVPAGSYVVTPSIAGPSSVFSPATLPITVNTGGATVPVTFQVELGYEISGNVTYAGTQTGPIYISLTDSTGCGNNTALGTVLFSPGAFTIRGVSPGSYSLQAYRDPIGFGAINASDATGSYGTVTVATTALTGVNFALADPTTATTLTAAPKIQSVSGFNSGAIVVRNAITDSNNVELATSYTLQWSTSPSFASVTGSQSFKADGPHGANVWLVNGLPTSQPLYFRAEGAVDSVASGVFSAIYGPVTIAAPAPAGGVTVSGQVSFTGTPTGPLYTGFFDQNTASFYGEYIASPSNPQTYSVQVPTGSNYVFVGILDQNKDGLVDAGDIQNTDTQVTTSIAAATTGENLVLPTGNVTLSEATNHERQPQSTPSDTYGINLQTKALLKLPVTFTVTAASNANVMIPSDVGLSAGSGSLRFSPNLGVSAPAPGDTYTLLVTYSDGTTENVTATVGLIPEFFATALAPTTGPANTSLTPTFSWVYPANATDYTYSFYLSGPTGTIWQFPGNNSNGNGFPSTITPSVVWDVDPTGSGNTTSVTQLTTGTTYYWQIQASDISGNSATTSVTYIP